MQAGRKARFHEWLALCSKWHVAGHHQKGLALRQAFAVGEP